MTLMGIDWGTQHIGIALSDYEGRMAFPLKIIPATSQREVFESLKDTITAEGVTKVVVGVPVGTVMSRLSRARSRLRELMDKPAQAQATTDSTRNVSALRRLP